MADLSSYINITANTVVTANLSATGNVISNSVISTTGNVTGNYILGNGSQLTGLPATYGNANVVANLAALGSNPVSTTGTVTSGNVQVGTALQIIGSTNTLQTTNGSAVQFGNRVNFNQTGTSIVASGNISGTNIQGSTLSASGNVTGSNVLTGGIVSATGNVTGNYFIGNGSQLTGLSSTYGNANVVANLAALGSNPVSTTGNIAGGNAILTGTANTGVYALDVGATATFLSNTVASFTANVNNYTQLTLQNLSTGADATADFILTADNGSDTVNYGDFGIIDSGYDNSTPTNSLGNIVYAADTYLYAQGNVSNTNQSGGNLVIGTSVATKTVKIFAGGNTASALVANISNTGVSVTGNVTASNFIGNISITGNVTGTSSNVTLVAGSYSTVVSNDGNVTAPSTGYLQGGTLKSTNSTGNEGGELQLALAPNATISGSTVSFDSYVNRVRIFEGGGNARGVYIDLSKAPDGVGGELMWKASSVVNAGVDVTLGNLRARIPTSGNRSLQVSTVTGTYSVSGSGVYYAGGAGGATINGSTPLTITTTPAYLAAGLNFSAAGYTDTWNLYDAGNSIGWRITLIIGVSYANNMISIERLV